MRHDIAHSALITMCHLKELAMVQIWSLPQLQLLHELYCSLDIACYSRMVGDESHCWCWLSTLSFFMWCDMWGPAKMLIVIWFLIQIITECFFFLIFEIVYDEFYSWFSTLKVLFLLTSGSFVHVRPFRWLCELLHTWTSRGLGIVQSKRFVC